MSAKDLNYCNDSKSNTKFKTAPCLFNQRDNLT